MADVLPLKAFFKKSFLVLQGTLAAQAISFVLYPILTRVYSPAAFGIFQAAQSILTIILVAAALRYEIPILTATTRSEATAITTLSLGLNAGTTVIVLLCCLIAKVFLLDASVKFGDILTSAPLWFLFAGFQQTFSYTAFRDQAFRVTAIAKVLQTLVSVGVAILLGSVGLMALGLVIADILAKAMSAGFVSYQCGWTYILRHPFRKLRRLRMVMWRYRKFPSISLVSALINGGGGVITPLLVLAYFDAATAGQYALVERTIGAAIAVVAQSISQVFMGSFSESLRGAAHNSRTLFRQIIVVQFAIGLIPSIVSILILPTVIAIVFGPQWHLAGDFAAIMSPLFLVGFIVTPVNMALALMEKQQWQLLWDVFRLAGVILIWWLIASIRASPQFALILHVSFSCAVYIAYLGIVDWLLSQSTPSALNIAGGNS